MTDQSTILRAAEILAASDFNVLNAALGWALWKAAPAWDDGLSFDEAVSALIAVERRAKQLREQEGK
jgi:hypothetical protein